MDAAFRFFGVTELACQARPYAPISPIMRLRSLLGCAFAFSMVFASQDASAALTASEKAQVRDFVVAGRSTDAAKIRSLVARTDLSADESAEVLTFALASTPLSEPRKALLHELVFGMASAPSRPVVTQAVVKGLLARADAVLQRAGAALDKDARAVDELTQIYAFLDTQIANAGAPTDSLHDATIGVPQATYDDCAKAVLAHLDRHARWLKGAELVPANLVPVRAQAQVAFVDMLPDGLTRRVDAADRLGLKGPRHKMTSEWGILLADAGDLSDAKVTEVTTWLGKWPSARTNLEVIYVTDVAAPLHARGTILHAPRRSTVPFPEEVTPAPFDADTAGIGRSLAGLVAKRALDAKTELRTLAERDAAATKGDPRLALGTAASPSVDAVIGAAIQLLSLDPQRTTDAAAARFLDGKPESAALLSDAVGALEGIGLSKISGVQLAPAGYATGFSLDGHVWTFDRTGDALAVTKIAREGKPVTKANLTTLKKRAKPSN